MDELGAGAGAAVDASHAAAGGRGRGRSRGRGRGRGRGHGGRPRGVRNGRPGDEEPPVPADADALMASPGQVAAVITTAAADPSSPAPGATNRGKRRGGDKKEPTTQEPAAPKERTPLDDLAHAIRRNDRATFDQLLRDHRELSVNTRTSDGDVLLVEACRFARVDMATDLVTNFGADVNATSTNRTAQRQDLSPLVAACLALEVPLVELLLQSHSVNLLHGYGAFRLPAPIVCALFCIANGYAKEQEDKALVILKMLLDEANERGEIATLFAFQTQKGNQLAHMVGGLANWRAIQLMKTYGADFQCRNPRGQTPLQMIEFNSFSRRSFAYCEPPAKKRGGKKLKDGSAAGENAQDREPESQADRVVKTHLKKRVPHDVEEHCVKRTLAELTENAAIGVFFTRRGDDVIRMLHLKALFIADRGLAQVANEVHRQVSALPKDSHDKEEIVDGFMQAITTFYQVSLKNHKEFRGLWKEAIAKSKIFDAKGVLIGTHLNSDAFLLVVDSLLSYLSLSRRMKTWAMIIMELTGVLASDKPITNAAQIPLQEPTKIEFFHHISDALYRSGAKMMFCIFDRTDIDEDDRYDEEIEYHLIVALVEFFMQFFAAYAQVLTTSTGSKFSSIADAFREGTAPVKRLWVLVLAALESLHDTMATPQRFSIILHVLQVIEQVQSALDNDVATTFSKLYDIMRKFVKKDASKKKIDHRIADQVQLMQTISSAFPVPASFIEKLTPLKEKIDILLRSDPKILGMDFYTLASIDDVIRLEHKVDYLTALAEESHGSIAISISRASAASIVDFLWAQVMSTSVKNMKGELSLTLVNEPAVGMGVIREFFQMIQKYFFDPTWTFTNEPDAVPPPHVTEIGSQWLQLARSSHNGPEDSSKQERKAKRHRHSSAGEVTKHFPLFEHIEDSKTRELRVAKRKLVVRQSVLDAKKPDEDGHICLTHKDFVEVEDDKTIKSLYTCAGRLLGLAIRHQQPLNLNFPRAFWKFVLMEELTLDDLCGSNEVFKKSLQFIIDHDFSAEDLDVKFDYTADVAVLPSDEGAEPKVQPMEVELSRGLGHIFVNNENKLKYASLRAQQFFIGNEYEKYKKLREGIHDAIALADLKLFTADELRRIVFGEQHIDLASLKKAVIYSRGASPSFGVVKHFWDVVEQFDQVRRQKLLTFWSGSPLPPLFGFDAYHERYSADTNVWYIDVDTHLKTSFCPQVNTCDRRLMLPDYPTPEMLKEKLMIALEHGAVLSPTAARCVTDCAHEFCLSCICRHLAGRKNHCPACDRVVKTLHQVQPDGAPAMQPAHIKFCNATYVLNVSIWAVADPARVLADLFHLQHARLIHQGKLLKKGDVWPGTVVQLFGTSKCSSGRGGPVLPSTTTLLASCSQNVWLQRLWLIVCCPFTVIYAFFASLFGGPPRAQQRGYQRIPDSSAGASQHEFHAPGNLAFDTINICPFYAEYAIASGVNMASERRARARGDGRAAPFHNYHILSTPPRQTRSPLMAASGAAPPPDGKDKTKATKAPMVPFAKLFTYADTTDKFMMVLGTIAAFATGTTQPLQIVVFGDTLNAFNPAPPSADVIANATAANATVPMPDPSAMQDSINKVALRFVWLGLGVFVSGLLQVGCWTWTASRQARRLRHAYVKALLSQEMGWFDVNEPMTLATKVADRTFTIQAGMGQKVGEGCNFVSMAVSGIAIGIVKGWKLGLTLLCFTPVLAIAASLMIRSLTSAIQKGIEAYGNAGAVAEESLGNVRTVHGFNLVQVVTDKYASCLRLAEKAGIQKGFAAGWGTGLMFGCMLCTYSFGMYYGTVLVAHDQLGENKCTGDSCYTGGRVMTVFSCIIMGAMGLGQTESHTKSDNDALNSVDNYATGHDSRSGSKAAWSEGRNNDSGRYDSKKNKIVPVTTGNDAAMNDASMTRRSIVESQPAETKKPKVSKWRIWKMSSPDVIYIVLGALGGSVNGGVFPVWGVLLTKVVVLFYRLDLSADEMKHEGQHWAIYFLILAIVFALAVTMQNYCFGVVSERLTTRMRLAVFRAMLRQEVGWFDLDANSSGALTTRLATDCAVLQAMTTDALGRSLVTLCTVVTAFSIAFSQSWQMTLVLLAIFPLLGTASMIQMKLLNGSNGKKINAGDSKAGALLSETIGGIRTVASFHLEGSVQTST
ncbi:TPA: hypothetical protein N0F65_011200 [Lagenidium giganteum]|uniref:Uncharacterized protein n=1 Tax=Lagenidium giganteum TaxID=4803 RepID=A0AAV2ZA58_9STRA|nr:TPA: hypothetical protein N0F65_011200 [Lagenidium giganteum]